jgi:hypothetical protein
MLKGLLSRDVEEGFILSGISKGFIESYLETGNPPDYGDFIENQSKALAEELGGTNSELAEKFRQMIKALEAYEALLYSTRGYRDHIAHAVRVGMLGYHLLARQPLSKFFSGSMKDFQTSWLLTSLFHDICVPLSRLSAVQSKIRNMMNSYSGIEFEEQAAFKIKESVYPKIKRVFSNRDVEFCFDFTQGASRGSHGPLAAAVLVDTFFGCLNDSILSNIATSVCLHDQECKVDFNENPLAGLLVIADELQEWDRPFVDQKARNKALKLDFIDLETSSMIVAKMDYLGPSSIDAYIPVGDDETKNFDKKKLNLSRFSFPFGLTLCLTDRNGSYQEWKYNASM